MRRSAVHSMIGMDERPKIDTSGAKLVYAQVADHLAGRIERGELAPGSRLPPERELAEFYQVAYDTIRRATAVLRERGLIVTVHGRGTFVTEDN
jgi:GntR family transcriptional regulator